MRIASAATALPKHRYDQQTILEALKFHWADKLEVPDMLDRLHARTGVETRSLGTSSRCLMRRCEADGLITESCQNFLIAQQAPTIRFKHQYRFANTTAGLQANGQPVPNTGNTFAGFELGAVSAANFSTYTNTWQPRSSINSLYFQDDWKFSQKLTFNKSLWLLFFEINQRLVFFG